MNLEYIAPDNFYVMNKLFQHYNVLNFGMGCEVGVREGKFSEFLLHNNSELLMICVDPYKAYMDREHWFTEDIQNTLKKDAHQKLAKFKSRVDWAYYESIDAAKLFDPGFFDFVYIDACHEYKNVKTDMEVWITKVRSKGWLCGHDYSMDGVKQAVTEISAKYGKLVYTSPPETDCWWFEI